MNERGRKKRRGLGRGKGRRRLGRKEKGKEERTEEEKSIV